MESATHQQNWLASFRRRLARTGDLEPGQAKLRIAIGFMVVAYIFFPWTTEESYSKDFLSIGDTTVTLAGFMSILYSSCSLAIFAAIIINPVTSPVRRVIGTVLDTLSLSFLMFHSGDASVPLFFIYLWVILGNGFRYGVNYLYISQATSIAGFLVVVLGGEYWQQNQSFGTSLFMMLCLLPLYAAFLLKKLHSAIAMAKQANDAKSRFLANMSHELRTPFKRRHRHGRIAAGDKVKLRAAGTCKFNA